MGSFYSKGAYEEALALAKRLERKVVTVIGPNNPIHASCINNVALMQKMMGNLSESLSNYEKSLEMYRACVGSNHPSYLSTVSNIGVLYKSLADRAEDENSVNEYLKKAEESLASSLRLVNNNLIFLMIYLVFWYFLLSNRNYR